MINRLTESIKFLLFCIFIIVPAGLWDLFAIPTIWLFTGKKLISERDKFLGSLKDE